MSTSMAGKPNARAIVPDPRIPTLIEAYSQAGPSMGPAVPAGAVMGGMVPTLTGTPSYSMVNGFQLGLARGGDQNSGEWCFNDGTANDVWYGKDDPRHFWGHHSPNTSPSGWENGAVCYVHAFRRIVLASCASSGGSTIMISVRNVDTDSLTTWTNTSIVLDSSVSTGGGGGDCSLGLVDLPDGRILMAVRVDQLGGSGPEYDFDMYQSEDGGDSWIRVSRRVLAHSASGTAPKDGIGGVMFRMARSGEYIRLCYVCTDDKVQTAVSTDRGISWRVLPEDVAATWSDRECVFDICATDDSGGFLYVHILSSDEDFLSYYVTRGDGAWVTGAAMQWDSGAPIRSVALCRRPPFVYGMVTNEDDAITLRRAPQNGVNDPQNATGIGWRDSFVLPTTKPNWITGRLAVVSAGPAMFHMTKRITRLTFSNISDSNGTAYYSDTWSGQPIGEIGPGDPIDTGVQYLYNDTWHPGLDEPGAASPGDSYTKVTSGTGAAACDPDVMILTGSSSGSTVYFQTSALEYSEGGSIEFEIMVPTGSGITGNDNIAVRCFMVSGSNHREFSIRIKDDSIIVYDHVASTTRATIGLSPGRWYLVRFTYSGSTSGNRLDVCLIDNAASIGAFLTEWQRASTFSLSTTGTGGSPFMRWGHLGQAQSSTMTSNWRAFRRTENTSGRMDYSFNQIHTGLTWPAQVGSFNELCFGAACSPSFQSSITGVDVAWGGYGGAEENVWDCGINFAKGCDNVWLDSPRLPFETGRGIEDGSEGNYTLNVYDFGGESGENRTEHDAIAVFGCNVPTLTLDWDNSASFPSPATETLSFTRYGSDSAPLTVAAVAGTRIRMTGMASRFVAGDLVGQYVKFLTGSASGIMLKITRHMDTDSIHFDEITSDLAALGVANTDTFMIYGTSAAMLLAGTRIARYFRVSYTDTATYEMKTIIGTMVLGKYVDFDVPMSWEFSDDEEDLVTEYQGSTDISWTHLDGPPPRRIRGTVVGDNSLWRQRFRGILRQVGGSARACAFMLDSDRPNETVILGRFHSSGRRLNQAWKRSGADYALPMGDMEIDITEVT